MRSAARDRRPTHQLDPDDLDPDDLDAGDGELGLLAWTGSDGAGATGPFDHPGIVR